MTVNVNSNTVFDNPFKYLDMHSKFATGILPLHQTITHIQEASFLSKKVQLVVLAQN